MSKITKEFIKETLLRIYKETGEPPKRNTKIPEFSAKTVSNKFGSWGDALTAAGIPLRFQPPEVVECVTCGVSFNKQVNQIKKSVNNFCSRSCAASHRNTNRIVSEETRKKTSQSMKEYIEANPDCNKKYSDDQVEIVNGIRRVIKYKNCIICDQEFKTPFHTKTCSEECLKIRQTQAGMASQKSQQRRSKGETLFFKLCSNYFGEKEVLSNAQVFIDKNGNFWDADIVIPVCKLAVCYNGIWHYQQVGSKHNLKQVQSRDSIKELIIFDNGYIQYIIKDTGKFNEMFVYEQFHIFIFRFLIHLELKMSSNF